MFVRLIWVGWLVCFVIVVDLDWVVLFGWLVGCNLVMIVRIVCCVG